MIIKINNKNIKVTIEAPYYCWRATIDYIKNWLDKGFTCWVLKSKSSKKKIWEWKIYNFFSYIQEYYYWEADFINKNKKW